MYHIRKTKTASGSTAIQVVSYIKRKLVVATHIGSGRTPEEISALLSAAEKWMEKMSNQPTLPLGVKKASGLLVLDKCKYLGIKYFFVYEIFKQLLSKFKLTALHNPLLMDLVIMRIIEPASKLHSLTLLKEYFDVVYSERKIYSSVAEFADSKDKAEKIIVDFAVENLNFDFTLIFYDVTTLYFESFEADELRKPGFSKDNKSQQPQIVIGLCVNKDGFPIAYEVFEGNKFEGKTIIPVILDFKAKHKIETLTVVADAAMISFDNVESLKENRLKYIVGARISGMPLKLIRELNQQLTEKDGATVRVETSHGDMVCSFSAKRYAKDKREMEKQIKKAEEALKQPSKMKRKKFIAPSKDAKYELNNDLIEKTKLLLGLKGYHTNLEKEISDQVIINHYHNLWHVEQAFRVAKGDLQMRPIYHQKQESVKSHVLICFLALAISKYVEIRTGKSIKYMARLLRQVTDARLKNMLNDEIVVLRSEVTTETKGFLEKLGLSY